MSRRRASRAVTPRKPWGFRSARSPSFSAAGEVRCALLEERGHALLEVLSMRGRRLELRLELELLLERRGARLVEQPLRHADRPCRQRGLERCELSGARGEL